MTISQTQFLGAWYNYKSNTKLYRVIGATSAGIIHAPVTNEPTSPDSRYEVFAKIDQNSSHDYTFSRTTLPGGPSSISVLPTAAVYYVQFQGFGAECGNKMYLFSVSFPGEIVILGS